MLQQQFEIARGILAIVVPPLSGVLCDLCVPLWERTRFVDFKPELQYWFPAYTIELSMMIIICVSIIVPNVWFFLVCFPILFGLFNNRFITSVNISYPATVRATFLAMGNVLAGFFNFIQTPVVNIIKVLTTFLTFPSVHYFCAKISSFKEWR